MCVVRSRLVGVATEIGRTLLQQDVPNVSHAMIQKLASITDKIDPRELGINSTSGIDGFQSSNVSFVRVFANEFVEISMFAIPRGFSLPLHDHPNMYVASRVVSGSLLIDSHSWVDKPNSIVSPLKRTVLSTEDATVITEPKLYNIHQISAPMDSTGGVLFDVIVPPYGPPRYPCSYYTIKDTLANSSNLQVSSSPYPPLSFYTSTVPYAGAPFLPESGVHESL